MGRLTYVCATCSEHFTRKYSARRHNQNLHNGMGEIVRLIDYLAGRSSGQYPLTIHPSWYKRNNPYHNIGSATVADSTVDIFQSGYIPQQASVGTSQYYTSPTYRPMSSMGDQIYGTGLCQGPVGRIKELKGLMTKFPQYDGIIRLAIFNSINGDNTLLDQMLEQLHGFDSLANNNF
jgi:hypothetical protein